MIRESTFKRPLKENVMEHAANQNYCAKKTRKVTQDRYQNRNRVLGYGANDWLTAWQAKNEL